MYSETNSVARKVESGTLHAEAIQKVSPSMVRSALDEIEYALKRADQALGQLHEKVAPSLNHLPADGEIEREMSGEPQNIRSDRSTLVEELFAKCDAINSLTQRMRYITEHCDL